MAATKSKERKSLCEESMLVILNILKFSSLSLARIATSSSTGAPPPAPPKRLAKSPSVAGKAHRAPERGSKLSYVMLPTAGGDDSYSTSGPTSTVVVHHGGSTRKSSKKMEGGDGKFAEYIKRFHEKTENEVQNSIVECKASDYIKRFHEKNRKDSNNESKRLPYAVVPPHFHLSPPNL